MRKKLLTTALTGIITTAMSMTAFASGWAEPTEGCWIYQFDDGTYATGWTWIDENNDGTAECYNFNEDGSLVQAAENLGYTLNFDDVWTENGIVQTKQVPIREDGSNSYLRYVGTYNYLLTIDYEYGGQYTKDWNGQVTITASGNQLYVSFGAAGEILPLKQVDKAVFQYSPINDPNGSYFISLEDYQLASYNHQDSETNYFNKN